MAIFGEMHSLEFISLANNSLRHLVRDVFQPIMENIQVIDVHGEGRFSHFFTKFTIEQYFRSNVSFV